MRKIAVGLLGLFIVAIFIGDVWLVNLTLPLSMLLIPLIFATRPSLTLRQPAGAYLLLGMVLIVAAQIASGLSLHWKADLAVWSPIVFAGATIVVINRRVLSVGLLRRSMYAGGFATGVIMVAMMVFAPNRAFMIPGQDAHAVEDGYNAPAMAAADELTQRSFANGEMFTPDHPAPSVSLANPTSASESEASVRQEKGARYDGGFSPGWQAPPDLSRIVAALDTSAPVMSKDTKAFYDLKNRAKNLLGLSNYISVFFVFLFSVALFSGSPWIAAAMAALAAVTLSRFGVVFVVVICGGYFAHLRGVRITTVAACIAAVTVACFTIIYLLRDHIEQLPGSTSVLARLNLLETAANPIARRPLLGAQRSLIIDEQGYNIIWNPHNSLIWIAANFGLIGLALYLGYLATALRAIAQAARYSGLWAGALVGVSVLLVWSLVEIIVLTPAFEILFATVYVLAWNANKASAQI